MPRSIAVAVSGGADSMALVLLAQAWTQAHNVDLYTLTVDHGLRKASVSEARQVGVWMAELGVPHHILTWTDGRARTGAVQARAREARYRLMRGWCLNHGVGHLLTAHHREDQAETVLMRLRKGSGLLGLAAMRPVRDLGGARLVRPLLDVPKARLMATLAAHGQDWIEDPSNQNPAFERVRTRELLTHLEGEGVSAERLAGAAKACAQVRQILEHATTEILSEIACPIPQGGVALDLGAFLLAPEQVRELALARSLQTVGCKAYPPPQTKLRRLLSWLGCRSTRSGPARTLGGCEVRLKAECIHILPEAPRKAAARARKKGEIVGNKCATALALKGQTSYIQGNPSRQCGIAPLNMA